MDELNGSELGTKSYWNDAYTVEIANFEETGDVGEVWFGEDSIIRVVQWFCDSSSIKQDDSIIDIGCGNGMSLVELAREGFTNLTGIDYSLPAIQLASTISNEFPHIKYKHYDILIDDPKETLGQFKVVHDKGTYDAVSLNPDDPKSKRLLYIEKVAELLKSDGFFVITSCNWTQHELCEQFKDVFVLKEVIPTPQFKFGGKIGNVVTSVVFSKIQNN